MGVHVRVSLGILSPFPESMVTVFHGARNVLACAAVSDTTGDILTIVDLIHVG